MLLQERERLPGLSREPVETPMLEKVKDMLHNPLSGHSYQWSHLPAWLDPSGSISLVFDSLLWSSHLLSWSWKFFFILSSMCCKKESKKMHILACILASRQQITGLLSKPEQLYCLVGDLKRFRYQRNCFRWLQAHLDNKFRNCPLNWGACSANGCCAPFHQCFHQQFKK